ncbi:MAG TPA: AI-2E family transporter [Thermoanaerobaculia bacterium]|nr:AI-2E family transporter [Thermoanaerobaculia bacterium]
MDDSKSFAPRPVARFGPFAIVVYGLLTILVFYAAFLVLKPFLTPLLLALVVVTLTYGMFERLSVRLRGRRNLAASLMLLFITLVLAVPTTILIFMLVDQAGTLIQRLQGTDVKQFFGTLSVERRLATLQRWIPWLRIEQVRLDEIVRNVIARLPAIVATQGSRLIAGFFGLFIGFLLMLLGAFVFYTKGGAMLRELRALSPLPDEYDDQIFTRFRGVVDATFRGQFLTAIAQGLVAGIGLAIAGVPAPIFWGAIAAVFSLIPMVGAAAVWVPSSIYLVILASQGSVGWWRPIFLIAWGVLVVSLVDNFVRPLVMRSGVNMHPIILFFAILGGIQAFGFTGLFLGPLVFVLLVTMTDIYKAAFAEPPQVISTGRVDAPP